MQVSTIVSSHDNVTRAEQVVLVHLTVNSLDQCIPSRADPYFLITATAEARVSQQYSRSRRYLCR